MAPRDPARGARIRDLRENRNRTQVAVAEALGVTRKAYQLWEEGGNIAWPNAQALAAYFNESVDYILDGIRQADGEDPIVLMERRVGRLEATVSALAALPGLLRDMVARCDALESVATENRVLIRDHAGVTEGYFTQVLGKLDEAERATGERLLGVEGSLHELEQDVRGLWQSPAPDVPARTTGATGSPRRPGSTG